MNMPLAPFTDTDTLEQRPLRLVNGSNSCLGRVEVFHNQKWGTVCDDTWDLQDAAVVCRQLGCGMVLSAPGSAHFGPGSDPIWLDNIHCTGTESTLTECELKNWGEHNCAHSEDAGVVCSGNTSLQGPGRVSQDGWCPPKVGLDGCLSCCSTPGLYQALCCLFTLPHPQHQSKSQLSPSHLPWS